MNSNRKLKRSRRQKKKKKKQMVSHSSSSRGISSADGDMHLTVSKNGAMRVDVPEDHLPEFLNKADKAIKTGQIDEARALLNDDNIEIVRQMVEKDPSRPGVMYILAMNLFGIGQYEGSAEWYQKILERKPHWAVYNELANIKEKQGKRAEAMENRIKALEANPDSGVVLNNHAMDMCRIGETQRGIELLRKALEKLPDYPVVHSNLVFFMHYMPHVDRQLFFEEHKRWARMQAPTTLARTSHDNVPDPNRRLRVGYISPDFCIHSVAFFFEILLDEHNRQAVETYGYSNNRIPDEGTKRLKSKFDHFQNIYGVSDKAVVDMIIKDKIDILVDLSGHTGDNRLPVLAYKPAPIQVTYLGYPNTTGMEQVDYRLTDELADPPESRQFYTEELVYLPDGFLCYRPPDYAPPVVPLPALKSGYITFGSFNNNCKINPFILSLWAEVLRANANSGLLLKFTGGDDKMLRDRYLRQFEQLGIRKDRIDIQPPRSRVEHLKLYGQMDIALDTYPYNGTTTTFEALWMGVPVVSLVGEHHMSRVGFSILTRFGMGFLAAPTPEEYVARATALAAKRQALADMRAVMRRTVAGASLCNTSRFAGNVEAAYRKMWHRWCRSRGVEVTAEQVNLDDQSSSANARICSAASITEPASNQLERRQQADSLEKLPVRIFHNLARAGGTLVCKCLGCMNKTVLLSEIHPLGTENFNPVKQAHEWHNLLTTEDISTLKAEKDIDFVDAVRLVATRCAETGQNLVIRDWAHLDFMAVPFLEQPSYRMLLPEVLAPAFEVIQLALVRHPVDQWLSLSKLGLMRGRLTLEMFLRGYLKFAEHIAGIGFVRYEDFTAEPVWQMKIICEKLRLELDENFLQKWHDYNRITGDTSGISRGSKLRRIQSLPRPPVSPELLQKFRQSDDYWQVMKLLGYSDVEQDKSSASHPTISISAAAVGSAAKTSEQHTKRKIDAKRIFVSSMPRAGSMWTYNIVRALIRAAGLEPKPKKVPIDEVPFISEAFTEPVGENQVYCVKTHYVVDPPEGDNDTLIIVPYRDIRDCVISYMNFRHADFDLAIRAMQHWNPTDEYFKRQTDNILKIRYDEIVSEPLDTIQKIDRFIGAGASFEAIEEIEERFSRKKVKEKVDSLKGISDEQILANAATLGAAENADGSHRVFDKATGFQTGHVTAQKDGQWREVLSEDQKRRLMQETSDWLERYGFEL